MTTRRLLSSLKPLRLLRSQTSLRLPIQNAHHPSQLLYMRLMSAEAKKDIESQSNQETQSPHISSTNNSNDTPINNPNASNSTQRAPESSDDFAQEGGNLTAEQLEEMNANRPTNEPIFTDGVRNIH